MSESLRNQWASDLSRQKTPLMGSFAFFIKVFIYFLNSAIIETSQEAALTKDLDLELTLLALEIKMKKIEDFLLDVKKNISLKNYTTFKIGGRAKYFFAAKNKKDIIESVKAARLLNTPFFILGEGSNLLVSDKGFSGLVVKMENKKHKIQNLKLYAESGVLVSSLIKETAKLGLSGLEWAGGLPGTIGGAVRGNAGAFGKEIKDNIIWVEAVDKNGKVRKILKRKCQFSYRSSIFKKNNWIVLLTALKLKKGNKKFILDIARKNINYRKEKHPLEHYNVGSIFKNCDLKKIPKRIRKNFSHVVKNDPFPLVPAAYLISEANLKGLKVGRAQVSKKHPNYIVNLGGAKARDVKKLIELVGKKVKKKFGVALKEEIQYLGFFYNKK